MVLSRGGKSSPPFRSGRPDLLIFQQGRVDAFSRRDFFFPASGLIRSLGRVNKLQRDALQKTGSFIGASSLCWGGRSLWADNFFMNSFTILLFNLCTSMFVAARHNTSASHVY